MPNFRINQFCVESDFALPCDARLAPHGGEPLWVRRVARQPVVPPASIEPSSGVRFSRGANSVLIGVENRILLEVDEQGREIQVQASDEHLQEAALYVVGAAMALCTALRGDIPLHASSVEMEGRRFGFLAPCGTGKSTTLWEFLEAGALFANDDLIPVRLCGQSVTATSCISLFPKVGLDLMERCPRGWEDCKEVLQGRNKFWFPIASERRAQESGALTALFALQPFEPEEGARLTTDAVRIQRQRGVQAISLLAGNSMTGTILPSILGARHLMLSFARIAEAVPVYTVRYAKRFEALPCVVDAVRQVVTSEGKRGVALVGS